MTYLSTVVQNKCIALQKNFKSICNKFAKNAFHVKLNNLENKGTKLVHFNWYALFQAFYEFARKGY